MKKWISILLSIVLICTNCYAVLTPYSGDVDDDGEVSVIDVTKTRAYIVGNLQLNDEEMASADMNKDKLVDIVDVICMRVNIIYNNGELFFQEKENQSEKSFSLKNIPTFSTSPYYIVNNNVPFFNESELTTRSYERYSELDVLSRCGVAVACIGKDIMPTEERGAIGMIKPTGWHLDKYDFVDGKYLYNRCHLIGYQLAGENANEKNLITGTRYLNVQGMLPFENKVADYVKATDNHVLYRVTPVFDGDNLLASGVLMEAYSVEDNGSGVCFNVFCYNAQPGVTIDYKTGDNRQDASITKTTTTTTTTKKTTTSTTTTRKTTTTTKKTTTTTVPSRDDHTIKTYILNTNTKKIHYPSCSSVKTIASHNKQTYSGYISTLISQGYSPCKRCNPS